MPYRIGILDKNLYQQNNLQLILEKIDDRTEVEHFSHENDLSSRHRQQPFQVVLVTAETSILKNVRANLGNVPIVGIADTTVSRENILCAGANDFIYAVDLNPALLQKSMELAIERSHVAELTDLKKAQFALRSSHRELEKAAAQQASILNTLPGHIALLNADGIIIAINDRWKIFAEENGLTLPNYGLGMSYFCAFDPDDEIRTIHRHIWEVVKGERTSLIHEYPCHSPEKQRWFTMIAAPLELGVGAVVLHLDITDRKLAEIEVAKAQADLSAIFDTTDDAFVLIGKDYKIKAFNRQAEVNAKEYFGQRYQPGISFFDYVAAENHEALHQTLRHVADGNNFVFQTAFGAAGNEHWYKIKVRAVRGTQGEVIGYCISGHNFTQQKETEIKLRASEERFRALIENSGELFTIADLDGVITYASPNIHNVLGDVVLEGGKFEDRVHAEEAAAYHSLFAKVRQTPGRLFHYINRTRTGSGDWRWIEGSIINLSHLESIQGIVSNFRDITSRVNVELDLKKNEYFLNRAARAAKLGYWILKLPDLTVQWSPQIFEMLQLSEAHWKPSLDLFYSIVHPDDLSDVRLGIEQLLQTRTPNDLTFRIIRSDNVIRWIRVEADFTYDESGNALQMLGTAQDITELKDKEERLRISKNNLDSLINSSQDFIWAVDLNGNLINTNRAYEEKISELYGIDHEIGQAAVLDALANKNFWLERYSAVLRGQFLSFEYSFPSSGNIYDIRLNPIFDGQQIIGLSGYARDITEWKKSQELIKKINHQYEILSRATNDAVWDWDIATGEVKWNHGMEHLFGHTPAPEKGTLEWWDGNLHPDDRELVIKSLYEAIRDKKNNWAGNYRFRCADGNYKYVFDRAYVVYEETRPVRMIGAMQDIDELTHYRKSLEAKVEERTRELHQALAKEKELAEMKNRFVSIASHEFRTPLATIEFATDFLKAYRRRVSETEIANKLATIERQVKHMAALLEDVLTVGKTEAGKITVIRTIINVPDFMTEVCESVERTTNHTHKIDIVHQIRSTTFYTDEKLLRNILSNLLSNAIKFSPGARTVHANCHETDWGYTFTILDHGIGILESDIKNIFDAFTRGSNVGTIPGTGLGLSIVKRTVELLGGNIRLSSKPGQTRFEVMIPKEIQHGKN